MSSGSAIVSKCGIRFLVSMVVLFVGLFLLNWLVTYTLLPVISVLRLPFMLIVGVVAAFYINGSLQDNLKNVLLRALLFGVILLVAAFALEIVAPFIYYASGSILLLETGTTLLNCTLFVLLFLASVNSINKSLDENESISFDRRQVLPIVIVCVFVIALPLVENLVATLGYLSANEFNSLSELEKAGLSLRRQNNLYHLFGFANLFSWVLLAGVCTWCCFRSISKNRKPGDSPEETS